MKAIAYDRPIPDAKADFYVSFNNEAIGKAIASLARRTPEVEGCVRRRRGGSPADQWLSDGRRRRPDQGGNPRGPYDGDVQDAGRIRHAELAPINAQQWAAGQIARFGDKIIGVVAANDGTGGGAIAAFKAAGVDPVPPVTGNDATIAALQLIIAGDQYNTISKPSEIVAAAAANVAVQLLKKEMPKAETMLYDTPSQLFGPPSSRRRTSRPRSSTRRFRLPAELCTGRYADGCKKLGIE